MGIISGLFLLFFFYKIANSIIKEISNTDSTKIENVFNELKRRAVTNTDATTTDYLPTEQNIQPAESVFKAAPYNKKKINTYPSAESLEITEAPYSNLEKGILDDVHLSKLPHHNEVEVEKIDLEPDVDFFKKVSLQQAFKYSIIFNRKHF